MTITNGLTGATTAYRFAGGTTSGAPGSGTFVTGDTVVDVSGSMWVCTAGGTPGTWALVGGDTSGVAAYSSASPGSGTKITPSSTSDCMVYLAVVTSATISVTMGPSTGAEATVYPSTATTNKCMFTLRVPKGHSYIINFTAGTPSAITQVL